MLDEGEKITFRVVTIGDSSVGKTCILNRFLQSSYNNNEQNTIGAFFHSYNVSKGSRDIELQIWDTAGQEQYRSLGTVYFRESAAAILVFDISNRQSFDNASEWLGTFRESCGNSPVVILVGNKIDLQSQRISFQEAKSWATEHGCYYVGTSAKTGEGISLLFHELVTQLTDKNVNISSPSALKLPAELTADTQSGCGC